MLTLIPQIINIQQSFIKTESIHLRGMGFRIGSQYKIKILNSYNNEIVAEWITDTTAVSQTELLISTVPEDIQTVLQDTTYYRIQIAEYISDTAQGTWSNLAIIQCITKPNLNITYNVEQKEFVCSFGDGQESNLNRARIIIKESSSQSEKLWDSGLLNRKYDSVNIAWDFDKIITCDLNVKDTMIYQVEYETNNGFFGSKEASLTSVSGVNSIFLLEDRMVSWLQAQDADLENGCNSFVLQPNELLYKREREMSHSSLWQKLNTNNALLYKDTCISYGTVQSYLLINKTTPDTIIIKQHNIQNYFEHSYLSDGTHSYCIRFNPKINSLKYQQKQEKIETLGAQYPFIVKNGAAKYCELSIGGLISMLWSYQEGADETRDETIAPDDDGEDGFVSSSLLGPKPQDEWQNEYQYRMQLLSWLTNGAPKVFKSPSEGNFIVQLLDVSLTPETALGRKLYSFSCTAIEIAEYNMKNLIQYKLL